MHVNTHTNVAEGLVRKAQLPSHFTLDDVFNHCSGHSGNRLLPLLLTAAKSCRRFSVEAFQPNFFVSIWISPSSEAVKASGRGTAPSGNREASAPVR